MSRARRGNADSTHVRQGAATPPSAFSQTRVSGPLFSSFQLANHASAQDSNLCSPGLAGLKNVEGKARRRRKYAWSARSRNAAIGIFSGPRLRPAVFSSFIPTAKINKPTRHSHISFNNFPSLR